MIYFIAIAMIIGVCLVGAWYTKEGKETILSILSFFTFVIVFAVPVTLAIFLVSLIVKFVQGFLS